MSVETGLCHYQERKSSIFIIHNHVMKRVLHRKNRSGGSASWKDEFASL